MTSSSVTPGPAGLKALAHPVRLRMLGLLRTEGPATATTLAARLGLNTGATSYHLRQLAQHGFIVEDAERGNARDRWWRAAHSSTRTDKDAERSDEVEAYAQAVAIMYAEMTQRAVEEQALLSDEWRRASTLSDWVVRLTPRRAEALLEALTTTIEETEDEPDEADAAHFVVQLSTYPLPGTVV
jgi:DNA-binding transcriptional ArsR family regulator